MQIIRTTYDEHYRLVMETLNTNDQAEIYHAMIAHARNEARQDKLIGQVVVIGDPESRDTYVELIHRNGCAVVRFYQEWYTVIYNVDSDTCYRVP